MSNWHSYPQVAPKNDRDVLCYYSAIGRFQVMHYITAGVGECWTTILGTIALNPQCWCELPEAPSVSTSRQTADPVVLPPSLKASLEQINKTYESLGDICKNCGFVKSFHANVWLRGQLPICTQFIPQNKRCGSNEAGVVVVSGGNGDVIEPRGVSVELPVHLL